MMKERKAMETSSSCIHSHISLPSSLYKSGWWSTQCYYTMIVASSVRSCQLFTDSMDMANGSRGLSVS